MDSEILSLFWIYLWMKLPGKEWNYNVVALDQVIQKVWTLLNVQQDWLGSIKPSKKDFKCVLIIC